MSFAYSLRCESETYLRRSLALLLAFALLAVPAGAAWAGVAGHGGFSSLRGVIAQVQPKIVKIYGAGGFRGMEAYQSGLLISPEGHILTIWSHVLDTDVITVNLSDGRRFQARLLGADPRLELAVLKIDAKDLPAFAIDAAVEVEAGARVLAFSNLFGVATGNEPASVQHGTVSVRTELAARRGAFETPYHGPVYVLDAVTNNPGAAGGALVTPGGQLTGMLGKELRSTLNNTWLNYAIPIAELHRSVDEIRGGKFVARQEAETSKKPDRPLDLQRLGLVLVPDVVERTPPFVEGVRPDSPAAKAGLRADDLLMLVGDRLVASCKAVQTELGYIDFEDRVKVTALRGQELVEFVLQSSAPGESP
jgi:serine protease Do